MTWLRTAFALMVLAGVQGLMFSAPAAAAGKVCKLQIAGNDGMQFDKKELLVAPDCAEVQLTLTHTGKLPASAMGHNWVLVRAADLSAVATAAMGAGLNNNYLPPGDKRVLAATTIIGGGQTTSVKFSASLLKKGESFMYLCTFPAHSTLMKGTIKIG